MLDPERGRTAEYTVVFGFHQDIANNCYNNSQSVGEFHFQNIGHIQQPDIILQLGIGIQPLSVSFFSSLG